MLLKDILLKNLIFNNITYHKIQVQNSTEGEGINSSKVKNPREKTFNPYSVPFSPHMIENTIENGKHPK